MMAEVNVAIATREIYGFRKGKFYRITEKEAKEFEQVAPDKRYDALIWFVNELARKKRKDYNLVTIEGKFIMMPCEDYDKHKDKFVKLYTANWTRFVRLKLSEAKREAKNNKKEFGGEWHVIKTDLGYMTVTKKALNGRKSYYHE